MALRIVRVSEALLFHFTTKFLYLHNLQIYDKPRITYEPLLGFRAFFFKLLLFKLLPFKLCFYHVFVYISILKY